jgi:hypothetical protein
LGFSGLPAPKGGVDFPSFNPLLNGINEEFLFLCLYIHDKGGLIMKKRVLALALLIGLLVGLRQGCIELMCHCKILKRSIKHLILNQEMECM